MPLNYTTNPKKIIYSSDEDSSSDEETSAEPVYTVIGTIKKHWENFEQDRKDAEAEEVKRLQRVAQYNSLQDPVSTPTRKDCDAKNCFWQNDFTHLRCQSARKSRKEPALKKQHKPKPEDLEKMQDLKRREIHAA